jgi:hypothetical protein
VIRGNILEENRGPLGGGICAIFDSAPLIEENLIRNNRVIYNCCFPSRGAGIYADDTSAATIRRNLVIGNEAIGTALGGGISIFIGTVEENTICGNFADGPAGGVELPGEGATLARNIIVGNRSNEFADGIMVQRSTTLLCNDVWGNGEENYWGADPGEGDFSADPRFCGLPGTYGIPEGGESAEIYNLRDDSPCLPGQHPEGVDCGLIGARPGGCEPRLQIPEIAVPAPPRHWIRVAPNPTRPGVGVRIDFAPAREDPNARLMIIDPAGRIVTTLAPSSPGLFHWNGRLDSGRLAPAGLYFVTMETQRSPAASGTILVVR